MSEEMQPHEAEAQAGRPMPGPDSFAAAEQPLSETVQQDKDHDGGESSADEPLSAAAVEADKIAKIKAEIAELLLHGKDRRIAIGRLLIQLHDLLSKQGSGTFMKTVTGELHIPYTTAMGYMAAAKEADNPSCYEIGNNEPTPDVAEDSEAVGDPHAQAVEAAKAAEREKREQAKRAGRFSPMYRVDFSPVSPDRRDKCKARVKELGIAEAFTRFYNALFPRALSSTQGTQETEPQPSVVQPGEEDPVATEPAEVSGTGLAICLLHEIEARACAEEAVVPFDPAVDKIREQTAVQGGAYEANVY
jgi:hypothetical protein